MELQRRIVHTASSSMSSSSMSSSSWYSSSSSSLSIYHTVSEPEEDPEPENASEEEPEEEPEADPTWCLDDYCTYCKREATIHDLFFCPTCDALACRSCIVVSRRCCLLDEWAEKAKKSAGGENTKKSFFIQRYR